MTLPLFSHNIIYSNLSFHLKECQKTKQNKKNVLHFPLLYIDSEYSEQSSWIDHSTLSFRTCLLPQNRSQNSLLGNCYQITRNNAPNEICLSPPVFTPELFCQPQFSILYPLRSIIKLTLCTPSDIRGCLARLHTKSNCFTTPLLCAHNLPLGTEHIQIDTENIQN